MVLTTLLPKKMQLLRLSLLSLLCIYSLHPITIHLANEDLLLAAMPASQYYERETALLRPKFLG